MLAVFIGAVAISVYHASRDYITLRGEIISLIILAMLFYWFVL